MALTKGKLIIDDEKDTWLEKVAVTGVLLENFKEHEDYLITQ